MAEWVSGKITHIEHWTDALFSLQVNAPVDPLPPGSSPNWRWILMVSVYSVPTLT